MYLYVPMYTYMYVHVCTCVFDTDNTTHLYVFKTPLEFLSLLSYVFLPLLYFDFIKFHSIFNDYRDFIIYS